MNSITVAGNIARDAEVRYLPNGDPVAQFSVADNQGKDKPAIFWNCSIFGKRAEALAPYLLKGGAVTVSGTVTQRTYTDKQGVEKTATDIRVSEVALQGGKRESAPAPKAAPKAVPAGVGSGFDDMADDVPFLSFHALHDPIVTDRKATRLKAAR